MDIGVSNSAFIDQSTILSIEFGEQCKYVDDEAFRNCVSLIEINENNVLKYIGNYAFSWTKLSNIAFNELKTIGIGAFANCVNLKSISIPECITINTFAFNSCSLLENIDLPNVSYIGDYAFSNCEKLSYISIPKCNEIAHNAFVNCNQLENVYDITETKVGNSAFAYCYKLSNISFDKIIEIGTQAFIDCYGLSNINLNKCEKIGSSAFKNCKNLTKISLSVCSEIQSDAFKDCTSLSKVYIKNPPEIPCILQNTHEFCTCDESSLKCSGNITFYFRADTINAIDDTSNDYHENWKCWEHYRDNIIMMAKNNQIIYTTLDNNIADIYPYYEVTNNNKSNNVCIIDFKNIIQTLDKEIFIEPDKITSIDIPSDCKIIEDNIFKDYINLISFTPSETLENIKEYAFANCKSLTTFTIPESLMNLGEGVFSGCTNLEKFEGNQNFIRYNGKALVNNNKLICVLPKDNSDIEGRIYNISDIDENITSLGKSCFHGCKNIRRINISSNIEAIGDFAFEGCENLYEVHFEGDVPPEIGSDIFKGIETDFKIFVPEDKFGIYNKKLGDYCKYVYPKPNDNSIIYYANNRLNSTHITSESIYGVDWNLPYYKIPNVTSTPNCFKGTDVEKIILGEGITSITQNEFSKCAKLDYIYLSDNIKTFGDKCFNNCNSIKKIHIPDKLTRYGSQIFYGCHNLNEFVSYNKKYVSDDNRCYIKNSRLYFFAEGDIEENSEYIIPDTVFYINDFAFRNCTKLCGIELPNTLKTIGKYAFAECSNMYLTNNTIPNNITNIGIYAFKDCINIKGISIPNNSNFIYIPSGAFKGCTNMFLKDNTIPNNIISIQDEAFENCGNINITSISNNLTIIGKKSFKGCTDLNISNLPNSLNRIGESAFEGCIKFKGSYLLKETTFSIPNNVTTIEINCFKNTGIEKLVISENNNLLTNIPNGAFENCSELRTVYINSPSLNTIGKMSFINCSKLENVNISSPIKSIGESAFENCPNIEKFVTNNSGMIVLPNSIEYIGDFAFNNSCKNITQIYLSPFLIKMGTSCFTLNSQKINVYIPNQLTNPPIFTLQGYANEQSQPFILNPPNIFPNIFLTNKSLLDTYKKDKYWKKYANYIRTI